MLYLYYVSCVAVSECVPASVWCSVVLEHFVCGMFWCFMHLYWRLYAWAVHTWLEACWCCVAGLSVGDVVSEFRLNHYWPVICGPWGFRGLWPLGTRGLYRLGSVREWVFYCGCLEQYSYLFRPKWLYFFTLCNSLFSNCHTAGLGLTVLQTVTSDVSCNRPQEVNNVEMRACTREGVCLSVTAQILHYVCAFFARRSYESEG